MTEKKIDKELMKDFCDGKSTPYKVMYGTMADMPLTFKIALIGNQTLNIEADEGIKRRIRIAQLDSEFREDVDNDDYGKCIFKTDKNFGTLLSTTYKHVNVF